MNLQFKFRFKKVLIGLIFMWVTMTTVHARDPWTQGDTYREIAALTLRAVDWQTTLDIAKNPDRYREANPILGDHPSVGRVNTFFIITTVIHPIISYYLPRDYRTAFQYISIGVSGTAATVNLWSGLKLQF